MTDKNTEHKLQDGPFEDTHTKTIKISPIEITITETRKSTHVPEPERGCGCGGGGVPLSAILDAVAHAMGPEATEALANIAKGTVPDAPTPFAGEGNPSS